MSGDSQDNAKQELSDPNQRKTNWMVLAVPAFLVICVWLLTPHLYLLFPDSSKERAEFGDMFGSANALFSGLAFAALFFTLYLQKEVLDLQRKDLKNAQDQSSKQLEQLKAQQQLLSKQNFEDSFFRLMDTLRYWAKEITAIQARRVKMPSDAREEAFSYLYAEFKGFYSAERNFVLDLDEIGSAFGRLKKECPELVNYFATVAMALFLLDECNVPDKTYFGMFLSSQLTNSEKLLLYYYGLCPGLEQIRVMIDKYSALYAIPANQLIPADHLKYYPLTVKPVQPRES
jgi:hypothetical protein